MSYVRNILLSLLVLAILNSVSCSSAKADVRNTTEGTRFNLVMSGPVGDPVEYEGKALGDDFNLTGIIGGISTITLHTGNKLYTVSPSVKTARQIDNPDHPDAGSADWQTWLVEPGRVNPLTFGASIGLDNDFTGNHSVGANGIVQLEFKNGNLIFVSFPASRGSGNITYSYNGFRPDTSITTADFSIPSDYLVLD